MSLVECIPNFSEGHRAEVIEEIVGAIRGAAGVYLLDVSSDVDHNRTVVTFAAPPDVVTEAAFRAIQTAAQHIDLDAHSGVHPRMGAADVVPLVPLYGVSMQVCIQLARALGERVGRELGLPVYLYEHAASRPERRNLADVRRHPYEVLKETIQSDPARRPDYGPAHLGPAGAVAVGAREPLIAFNAYLDTDDVSIAKAIARQVRQSSGGLPAVKALGLLVAGRAQVSMNIVDYRQTSLHTVMAAVRESAVAYGAVVTHTELVGLTPRAALLDAALECLQLPAAARALILENRLGAFTNNFQDIRFE